jgi:hypothetical protein
MQRQKTKRIGTSEGGLMATPQIAELELNKQILKTKPNHLIALITIGEMLVKMQTEMWKTISI